MRARGRGRVRVSTVGRLSRVYLARVRVRAGVRVRVRVRGRVAPATWATEAEPKVSAILRPCSSATW